jgi:phenylpropionate dioxygenase-like ring-hydroxylating dioxygenase large terminal subunit
MESHLSPKYYFDEGIFMKENENIFSVSWNFVCFSDELSKENDFITTNISDKPIVIQRLKGKIKAFINICSHRFSLIQSQKKGNRPLTCPYHGWSYSDEGVPRGIPKKPLFSDFSEEELCEMRLQEYKVEVCGVLVFVNLDSNAKSLKEDMGIFFEKIEKMTLAFGHRIDTNSFEINANWKVIIENTMEGYHLPLVHKETLSKIMPSTNMENLTFEFEHPHSNYIIPLNTDKNSKKNNYLNKFFDLEMWNSDGFIHYLIFPNLLISSSYGSTFNVSHVIPKNSHLSTFTSYLFVGNLKKDFKIDDINFFIDQSVEYNRKVFDEDKKVCELVQIGVSQTNQHGQLSLEELRVHEFQKNYLNLIQ